MIAELIAILIGMLMFMIFCLIGSNQKAMRYRYEMHRIEMLEQRNKQVYYFRLRLLHEFEVRVFEHCGTYEEMLHSDKPLLAKEWVKIDGLVNLN